MAPTGDERVVGTRERVQLTRFSSPKGCRRRIRLQNASPVRQPHAESRQERKLLLQGNSWPSPAGKGDRLRWMRGTPFVLRSLASLHPSAAPLPSLPEKVNQVLRIAARCRESLITPKAPCVHTKIIYFENTCCDFRALPPIDSLFRISNEKEKIL